MFKLFLNKEIKKLNIELDILWKKYNSDEFKSSGVSAVRILKPLINKIVQYQKKEISSKIANGSLLPKNCALNLIGNLSGDLVESGKYHMYRGVLNEMQGGQNLYRVYKDILDQLVKVNEITQKECDENKSGISENIKGVG